MKSALRLKEKLQRRELTLGILITNHLYLELFEVAAFAGLDYVIIDQEHVQHGDTLVADACRLGRMTDFPVLIRPPRTDAESIRLAVDQGAVGLLLPMIDRPEQLDVVRDGLYMPPRGQRRPGGHGNWWPADFNYTSWKEGVEDHFIILPQIESPHGLANADAIAKHELTTALAAGPYDLSARLGVCWQPESPKLATALQRIRGAAESAGKPMWAIGDGEKLRREGFFFLCIGEPLYLLRATLKRAVDELRKEGRGVGQEIEKAFVP